MSILYELKNIEYFFDEKRVLSIDNLILEENKIIGFFGPNGSGKSTLFSILSFISKPREGEVLIKNQNNLDFEIKKDIVVLPQNPYLLKRTVFENIAYGLKIRKDTRNLEDKVNEALALVGLENCFAKRKWSELSGGEAQRVALAARLILKPKILILDEPTSGVDTNSAQLIKEAILFAKQKYNSSIFISSHDYSWLNHISDKKIALYQGYLFENKSINLLFSPWQKDSNGYLVKVFTDNQRLTIPNSQNKKRDSILLLNSNHINISRIDSLLEDQNMIIGSITSISKGEKEDYLQIELSLSGVILNSSISKDSFEKERFFPSDKVAIKFDFNEAKWL